MLVQCCVCKKTKQGKRWVAKTIPESLQSQISHGYCPKCAAAAFAEIRRQVAEAPYEVAAAVNQ